MFRGVSDGSVSASEGDGSDGSDFVAPLLPRAVTHKQRAALTPATVEEVVRSYVNGNWTLRAGQYEVASALWQQQDIVCSFPTSAGKTLIMMLGALLDYHHKSLGVWIVCQPLEALRKTTAAKVRTEFFARTEVSVVVWVGVAQDHTGEPFDDPSEQVTVILCSPEQLQSVFSQLRRHAAVVRGLLVDEAHLRFAWEFRDYKTSDKFSTIFPDAAVGLFSATLDQDNANELVRLMAMRDVAFFSEHTFPNLRAMKLLRWDQFSIRCISSETDHLVSAILAVFSRLPVDGVVIVFASSYAKLAKLVEPLGRDVVRQFAPRLYCSAYSTEHKQRTCEEVNAGRCRLVGATCALGAGVDLLNVGGIIFFGCPKSFSDATQGMGRAGRGAAAVVEVVFASDSTCNSKVDNKMRLLMGYCSDAKSAKTMRCSVCETVKTRPGVIGAEDSYKTCFDFKGIHCQRDARGACKLAMCKFFDGLLQQNDLSDSKYDCGRCDSCLDSRVEYPVGCLVKYKGKDSVVVGHTAARRLQIREVDSLENHTVAGSSVSLVSGHQHAIPPPVQLNDLTSKQRTVLRDVLKEQFGITASQTGCMLLSSAPSDTLLALLSKWTPEGSELRCPIRFADVDMVAWFRSAHSEALLRHANGTDNAVEERGGEEEEEEEDAVRLEAAVAAVGPEIDVFEVHPRLDDYFKRHAGPLRQGMARIESAAQVEVKGRKQARIEIVEMAAAKNFARATQSLGGSGALPLSTLKKRRNTFSGSGSDK